MANSMTGFGAFETSDENAKISVEIRSVNHRYLDLNLKIGHRLLAFENNIRRLFRENVFRGKVDVSIKYIPLSKSGIDILYNKAVAEMYVERINKIAQDFSLVNNITAYQLSGMRDVLSYDEEDLDPDSLWPSIKETILEALNAFKAQRQAEGERLKQDLLDKLSELQGLVDIINEKSPLIIEEYKARLTEKLDAFLDNKDLNEQRIAAEVVIYCDKICIDEEIVRLNSHIKSFKNTMESKGDIGKKLDFITQEMNREANTILSKTTNPDLSDIGIEVKTIIEKIREQVQNIE